MARNAILISIDSLRADHLSLYGYPRETTPALTALLERRGGTVYRNATAVSPSCHPSHTAMLTGLYPQEVGVPWCGEDLIVKWSDFEEPEDLAGIERYQESLRNQPPALRQKKLSAVRNWLAIPESQETLGGLLRANGFHSAGAVAIWTLAARFGYGTGFERYVDAMPEYYGPASLAWLLRDVMGSQRRQSAAATIDAAISTISEFAPGSGTGAAEGPGREGRFFLFLNLADTHVPYDGRGETLPGESSEDRAAMESRWARRYGRDGWSRARREMSGPDGLLLDRYDLAIRHTDREIARLVDALAARGLLDDTLIVITSDHGDSFGQHPYLAANRARRLFFEHSLYVWEETQHVPLIVLAPGMPAGARYREVNVSQVDLKPTILAALGLAGVGEPGPGSDLAMLREEPRAVYFLTFGRGQPGLLSQTRLDFPRYIGLRRGSLKFFVDRERFRDAKEGSCFLFDLASDPDELVNLCGERPAEALQLRSILVDWYRHSTSVRTPAGRRASPR